MTNGADSGLRRARVSGRLKGAGGLIDRPFGEHEVEVRLIDFVLVQRIVDGEGVGEAIAQQLPRCLSRKLLGLLWVELAGPPNPWTLSRGFRRLSWRGR